MKYYSQSPEDITEVANHAVDLILLRLRDDGIIDENTMNKASSYRVIAYDRKNIFSYFHKKLFHNDDKLRFKVVEVLVEDAKDDN